MFILKDIVYILGNPIPPYHDKIGLRETQQISDVFGPFSF